MSDRADIAIIGAGAAGLAAAIFAAEAGAGRTGPRIMLLDGAKKIGAKILVSGGGRCNVTHEQVTPEDFSGTPHLVRNILAAFGVDATVRWFASLGVELKREDTGKLFPVTDRADTVLRALLNRCQTLGVEIRTNHRVLSIMSNAAPPTDPDFVIRHDQGECCARRAILATGGRSLPKTGSDGHGWMIAQELGHTVTPTFPALVPLVLAPGMFHVELAGVSQEVVLTTTVTGRQVDRRTGSLLWTHFGVSGPVVMDASRFWTKAKGEGDVVEMRSHFLPGMNAEAVDRWVRDQGAETPRRSVAKLVAMRVPDRFATALCHFLKVEPSTSLGQLTREQRRRVVQGLTSLALPVERDRGWNYAEVTAGGVPLSEINFRTMESRKVPGLYLIGEMLDCDGRIGGFNFQWAWSTGFVAGRGAAKSLSA
ncbi:MAG: NAD(P)/FAD-dependent oxidoreductase [Nitrospirae bacterium]|nr:NAD(P)/FAD-dependent oxidoreductase [Nitrospirota bacterium]